MRALRRARIPTTNFFTYALVTFLFGITIPVLAIVLLTTGFNSQSVTAKTVEIQTSQHTKSTLLVQNLKDSSDQTIPNISIEQLSEDQPNISSDQPSQDDWSGGPIIPKN